MSLITHELWYEWYNVVNWQVNATYQVLCKSGVCATLLDHMLCLAKWSTSFSTRIIDQVAPRLELLSTLLDQISKYQTKTEHNFDPNFKVSNQKWAHFYTKFQSIKPKLGTLLSKFQTIKAKLSTLLDQISSINTKGLVSSSGKQCYYVAPLVPF